MHVDKAPLSAVLRAAEGYSGCNADDDERLNRVLRRWLWSVYVVDIELTPEEYAAYSEARRPCDADG